jgi:hypothetical protein
MTNEEHKAFLKSKKALAEALLNVNRLPALAGVEVPDTYCNSLTTPQNMTSDVIGVVDQNRTMWLRGVVDQNRTMWLRGVVDQTKHLRHL